MKIKFRCFPELEPVLPKPIPAKRGMPPWLKTMPLTAWAADFEEEVKTVKGCPPVIDAMTSCVAIPIAWL